MMKALKEKPVTRLLVAVIIMAAGSWGCASNKTPNWIRASGWGGFPSAKELHLQKESVSADMSTQEELPEMTCEEHERLGDVNFSRGNIGTAFVQYQKSLQLNPKNSIIHYKIGLLFVVCGMNEDAVGEFREVLKKESNHALSHEGLGLAFFQMKQYEDAEECFRNAAEHDPKLWKPHNFLGIINDYNGRHKAAVREYEAALALKPDNRVLYNNLGTSYLLAGDYEKAVNVFNKAIATKKAYNSIYNNLGLSLSKMGRHREALEAFRKGGDEAQAYNNLGCIYLQNGDYEKAIRCFEKAIELKPTFYTNARENLKKAILARQLSLDSSLQTHFDGDHKKQKPRLKKDLGETRDNPMVSSKGEDGGNLDSILPEGKTDETEDQSPSSQKLQTEASKAVKPSAASGSKDTEGVAL
jgi:Flp pilus assembly protein TadD